MKLYCSVKFFKTIILTCIANTAYYIRLMSSSLPNVPPKHTVSPCIQVQWKKASYCNCSYFNHTVFVLICDYVIVSLYFPVGANFHDRVLLESCSKYKSYQISYVIHNHWIQSWQVWVLMRSIVAQVGMGMYIFSPTIENTNPVYWGNEYFLMSCLFAWSRLNMMTENFQFR